METKIGTFFFRLSYLDAQPPMMQYDVLMSCLADDTLKVVDNFDLASDKKHDVTTIINALERYAKGQINETVKHHNLLSRVQQPGERIDNFYLDLRELSRTCSFCNNCTKAILRDCIVGGVSSACAQQKLLAVHELTLSKAVRECQALETADLHQQALEVDSPADEVSNRRVSTPNQSPSKCFHCGKGPHQRTACPARHVTCSNCGKPGHFATVCRSKPVAQPAGARSHIATVIAATQTVDVLVTSATGQTVQVQAIPDTGADVPAAGPGFIDLLLVSGSLEELEPTTERPESADGPPMHVLGSVSVTLTIGEHSVQTPVLIVIVSRIVVILGDNTGFGADADRFPEGNCPCTEPAGHKQSVG